MERKVKGDSKPPMPPSLEEVAGAMLKELGIEEDTPGHTVRELAKAWGVGITTARRRIQILGEQGKIIEGRRTIRDVLGRTQRIRVVQLKEQGE